MDNTYEVTRLPSVFYAIKCFPSNLTHPNTIGHKGDFAVLVHPNGHNNIRKSTKVSFFHLWICLQSTNNVSVSSDLQVIYLFQFNYNMLENIVWLIIALLFVKQFFLGCPWANFSEAMFFTTRHTLTSLIESSHVTFFPKHPPVRFFLFRAENCNVLIYCIYYYSTLTIIAIWWE